MKNEKTWNIVYFICDIMFILVGIIGISMNLYHIDMMITEHFTCFMIMNVIYLAAGMFGYYDICRTEEDS